MTLDIRGSIKNTKLSSNPYVVFEELISNSIDSYLIRKCSDPDTPSMQINIKVEFLSEDMFENTDSIEISCTDNGCGFGDDQLKAFLTKDTSYKDDLSIPGIGRCKGAGRIQFFHYFSALSIDSTYKQNTEVFRREMNYSEPQKQIEPDDFNRSVGDISAIGTSVTLKQFKESIRGKLHIDMLSDLYSASILKKKMLVAFLQRLIGLESSMGAFEINFVSNHLKGLVQNESLKRSDLPTVTTEHEIEVEEQEPTTGKKLGSHKTFKLSHYKLDAAQYGLAKNSIALCAKSSPVKDITHRYLRTRTEQNNPAGGFHHIILIESDYLDQRVNEQRDNFENIPEDIPSNDMFLSDETLSYTAIYDAINQSIHEMVVPQKWNKEDIIQEVTDQFGISEEMLLDTSTRIVYGESAQTVAERVLKKYQERIADETAEIFKLKEEIIKAEPDTEDFRKKINDLSWKYTSSLKNIDMANLSQLIVRRAAIVQILGLACDKELAMQSISSTARRKDERIIHSIFFPMRKDSSEVTDHDMWLLSEEYHYYDYIASDLPLANIVWENNEKVFEEDIDDKLQELLQNRAKDNSSKRPDIALFTKEGSAIIVEFKAPDVPMDEHIGDLSEYAHLLAAKSGGKLKKIYGYLVGDTVNPLRLGGSWTPFPTGNGWFQSSPLVDPKTRVPLGETYFEILHFDDVIDRAKKRIGVYQNKLRFKLDITK